MSYYANVTVIAEHMYLNLKRREKKYVTATDAILYI